MWPVSRLGQTASNHAQNHMLTKSKGRSIASKITNLASRKSYTVKPDFKGNCDETTPCDQGTLSQNGVLSSPC